MNTDDHHKDGNPAGLQRLPLATLGDVRDFVAKCDLPASEISQIRSAIKRADELIGHGALDLAADPQAVLAKLEQVSPAMAGMSQQALRNLKSRVRKAFRLAEPG